MKVLELLESEWEDSPIETSTYMRDLRKKRAAINHRRWVIMQRIAQVLSPEFDEDSLSNVFTYWRLKSEPVEDFPQKSRKYVQMLKDLDGQDNQLQALEITAKTNMKFARHDPELAFHHAQNVRKGQYPEGEDAIASVGKLAHDYATKIIHHRFPKGEKAIKEQEPLLWRAYKNMFGIKK